MKVKYPFKIVSSGSYLPQKKVHASEIQEKMPVNEDWIIKKTGVENRHYAEDETIASMAAKSVKVAIDKANLNYTDIDMLIAAGGTPDQPIPHNSALIHNELGLPSHITCFDVNATCLSFVQALHTASCFINSDAYKRIIIVSSEKASVGLNYDSPESAALLGDGAVAFIIEKTNDDCGILFTKFSTHSEAVHLTEIAAGGTRIHPKELNKTSDQKLLFSMDGKAIYKKTFELFPNFYKSTMEEFGYSNDDFAQFIPHQASMPALRLVAKKLEIPDDKLFVNLQKYGNLVGASIPMALHEAIEAGKINKGEKSLIIATAAGLTLGLCGLKL